MIFFGNLDRDRENLADADVDKMVEARVDDVDKIVEVNVELESLQTLSVNCSLFFTRFSGS